MAKSGTERVKAYRDKTTTERLEIIGISQELKQTFRNIPGLEKVTTADKLKALIDYWIDGNNKNLPVESSQNNESFPDNKAVINRALFTDWNKLNKDFIRFLDDFKISNRLRPKLKTYGKQIREALGAKPEYRKAFKYICDKLPERILKYFKPMYLQGYFSLYEKELIEISQTEITEEIILILFESLKRMGKDEPVKEAKKALSLLVSYPGNKTESITNSLAALPDEDYKIHIKQPQQMSILEEVAKLTARDKAQPGKSNNPDDKVEFVPFSKRLSNILKGKEIGKSRKAAEPDKLGFGPGSKGVSNSVKVTPVSRKPVKTGKKTKGKKGKRD